MTTEIRFTDGASYERYMGVWSQRVGRAFLDWLAPAAGRRWLDIGCGSGAFTEVVLDNAAPSFVQGIDPSDDQLAYARARFSARPVEVQRGDAQALPFGDDTFDVAVMPLVIFFVPDPALGVAEMARVVSPGGTVAAYAWDMDGGGFPSAAVHAAMQEIGLPVPQPPARDASRLENLHALWTGAGLEAIATRQITVERTFAGFDEYWTIIRGAPSIGPALGAATADQIARLQRELRVRLPADAEGRITYSATANAVTGRVASLLRSDGLSG